MISKKSGYIKRNPNLPTFTGRGSNPDAIRDSVVGARCRQWISVLDSVSFIAAQAGNVPYALLEISLHL